MFAMSGITAVVTGAASGIGRALAQELAARGANLAIADVNEAGLTETASGCSGVKVTTHVVDVSDRAAYETFVADVVEAHGGVQLLINNAGVTVDGGFYEQTLEDFEWVMGVNFWGVVYGCKLFLPHLAAADRAWVCNISSVFGIVGIPAQSSYCASKFAVRGMSEALWEELRGSSIGLSVVHPGGVRTSIMESARSYDEQTYNRAVEFFRSKTMKAPSAARVILDGIAAEQPRILVTREAPLIDRVKRLFPVWGNKLVADMLVKTIGLSDRSEARKAGFLGESGEG
jgi:NAD(P)-dependent dehydrogenase (short-subunit alcohol dehydrogenase family)